MPGIPSTLQHHRLSPSPLVHSKFEDKVVQNITKRIAPPIFCTGPLPKVPLVPSSIYIYIYIYMYIRVHIYIYMSISLSLYIYIYNIHTYTYIFCHVCKLYCTSCPGSQAKGQTDAALLGLEPDVCAGGL